MRSLKPPSPAEVDRMPRLEPPMPDVSTEGARMRTISADAQYGSEMTLTESQAEYLVSTERPTEHRGDLRVYMTPYWPYIQPYAL